MAIGGTAVNGTLLLEFILPLKTYDLPIFMKCETSDLAKLSPQYTFPLFLHSSMHKCPIFTQIPYVCCT